MHLQITPKMQNQNMFYVSHVYNKMHHTLILINTKNQNTKHILGSTKNEYMVLFYLCSNKCFLSSDILVYLVMQCLQSDADLN